MQKPQKVAIGVVATLGVLAVISTFFCGTSFLQIETERFASIEPGGSILFVVRGFCACPLTAEGPFPTWSDSMRAKFNSIDSIQTSRPVEYTLGSDFASEYGALESGHISIDPLTKTVVLSGKYTSGYKWNRVIGKFPITYRADYRGN
jgi:hypothetical protein